MGSRPEGITAYGDVPGNIPDTSDYGRDGGDKRRPHCPGHALRMGFYCACALLEYGGGGAHGFSKNVYLSLAVVETGVKRQKALARTQRRRAAARAIA